MSKSRSVGEFETAQEEAAQAPDPTVSLRDLPHVTSSADDLGWGRAFRKHQVVMGWSVFGLCALGILWGSLPGHTWLPLANVAPWEYAVCLGVSIGVRVLCGLIIYEFEGFQVAAALTANRKITPDLSPEATRNIRAIQRQGALESAFGGRQLILVSTVLFPTIAEAAVYPLLPCFQGADTPYLSALTKAVVKTFAFAAMVCIAAQLSSQIKAIESPVAWMSRRWTKYVIKVVMLAETLGLIGPSQFLARKLSDHHYLDGQPANLFEWANWWTDRIDDTDDETASKEAPPFLLPPEHEAHIPAHRVLHFLLGHHDKVRFYEEMLPTFIYASFHGGADEKAREFWTWINENVPDRYPGNPPFVWRTSADSLGHVPPHHMVMVLFSSSLLILKNSESPDAEIQTLFSQFAQASFGDPDEFKEYWSRVRKFKVGSGEPLPTEWGVVPRPLAGIQNLQT